MRQLVGVALQGGAAINLFYPNGFENRLLSRIQRLFGSICELNILWTQLRLTLRHPNNLLRSRPGSGAFLTVFMPGCTCYCWPWCWWWWFLCVEAPTLSRQIYLAEPWWYFAVWINSFYVKVYLTSDCGRAWVSLLVCKGEYCWIECCLLGRCLFWRCLFWRCKALDVNLGGELMNDQQIQIFTSEDGQSHLEVTLEQETVWLSLD